MSKPKQLTDLLEEDNASASSPRRSSRIATRRLSSCDEISTSPPKTRSRRPSLTLENNSTPGKITRSKRSSLSIDSDSTKDNHSNSSPSRKITNSPADITSNGPAKRTRRRGSLSNSTQDEGETVSTPIPNRVSTRRLSGRRSMSKSPTRENNTSPILENVNLPKSTTPKRRGRRPSVTEKVIPLEAIKETELSKVEDESNSSKTIIVDSTDKMTENIDKKVKSENLETILESSILDNQEGAEVEKNLSKTLDKSSNNHSSDAAINKSCKKDKSIEILNLNDSSLNKSSKNKTLNLSQNASAKNNESVNNSVLLSPAKTNVILRGNKTAEIINLDEDVEKSRDNSVNKSKIKTKEVDNSNIEKAEKDLRNALNSSHNIFRTSELQESSKKTESSVNQLCEVDVDLSILKNETVNKSNESDKENQNKISSVVIIENSEINKESEDLFSEPMEIDDYPPDTSDEHMAKCNTPNNSLVLEQSKSEAQKEEFIVLSPIISSAGKRNRTKPQLLNSNVNLLYDVCANSTPKRATLNQTGKEQNDVESNTSSKESKDVLNTSTQEDNVKDKSKRNSKEFISSADLNESKRITRQSLSLNKSEQKSQESLNLAIDLNESKTKSNLKSRKSNDLNESDSNEKLRSSNLSTDESAKEDSINLEQIVNKSASKEKPKRKSQSRTDLIDLDQTDADFDEKSKEKSKNVSLLSDKSPFKENSKRKSKDLSQSLDKDKSIEKSVADEKTKQKFKDLLQSNDKEENIEKKQKSLCLSNLIDADDESDDEYNKSTQKSKNITEHDSETNVTSKSINLSKDVAESISRTPLKAKIAASNKAVDALKSDAELEATISKFVENYNLIDDDDDEHHALLDDQASEGEEDTPSENSCDIPVDGESLGSSDSENLMDESYEHDSFIVSDEETELLSGNEFDIDQSKVIVRRLKVVKDDDGDDDDNDNTINSSKTEEKKQEPEKVVEKDLDLQNTSTKSCSNIDKSSEKKKTSQKNVEEDSDLENMSIKPYCGLDPPSVASSRESLSEADKIEVSSKNTKDLVNLSKSSPKKSLNTSFGGSLNISVVEDKESTTRRSRTTSLLVQEQFENYNVENVCDHIAKVVNMVYSDPKKEEVDICLNVSLEFTEKRKSNTADTSNTTLDLQLPAENLSSDVISLVSSDEETSKKASKEVIQMDSSTDSDMSEDVDEDISTKYYESRLISKEEDMRRQSKSGVGKQAKPDPKFSSSSEDGEEEENEILSEELQNEDNKSSKPCNILGVTKLAKVQQGDKHNNQEGELDKIKILQSIKLKPEIGVQTAKTSPTTKRPISRECTEVLPSKKMKNNEQNLIKKKKQKLQPSKNLTEGDDLEINYFPTKILNTITNNTSNKKPRVVPTKSANQNSWNCKVASPLKPSANISTKKKSKLEAKINERDFKNKTLNDKSRNKRMDMATFLMMEKKLKQKVRP